PAPPRLRADAALSASTTFADGANTLTLTAADSSTFTVTFTADKAYSAAGIVDAVNSALGAAGRATLSGGKLVLSGTPTGPAASLSASGTALAALRLGTDPAFGADAEISVDGGVAQAVTLNGTADLHVHGKTSSDAGFTLSPSAVLRQGKIATNVVETTGTTTMQQLSDLLRGTGSPTSSALVDLGDGTANSLRLVLSATGTGTAGALSLSGDVPPVLTGLATSAEAKDAQIEVAGNVITRSTNSINDVIPGVTLGLVKASAEIITVGTTRDTAGLTSKAKAFVDALNNTLNEIETQTKYSVGASSTANGALAGNATARGIASTLFTTAAGIAGSGTTTALSMLGLTTTRDGRFALDADKLAAQVAADPDGVAAVMARFAKAVGTISKSSTQTGGQVTSAAKSAGEEATRLQKQIDNFEVRMVAMQKRLKAQYAAMDTALGTLSQRQAQLSAALSGL
ncbi:MAG: flagellar filament capping protein FliD, partial [Mycobacteriales bacterium]